ncbi:AAA family ATPase [Lactobacillus sp. S2-2]|uniref:RNA polymerase recycling motor HelD n=1 Tax=Lactobacillus sp. S2-2 TaxID=2692917 RepID=UPI001F2BB587|nr:RNA polymerase recycling motor HelD [Lactobacillus sp. S2-2]MCF6514737.1 AAA family ATPase [Lactobacillus sp. S2-2]
MNNKEIENYENKHVQEIIDKVKIAKEKASKKYSKAKQDQKNIESTFFDNVKVKTSTISGEFETGVSVRQQQQMLEERENRWQYAAKDIETLSKLEKNPYFARVDFKEDGENAETIYIGLSSFNETPEKYLIYDWRAPISSIYYDSKLGDVTYNTPMGEQHVNVSLKRQFEIEDGKIKTIFDTEEVVGDQLLLNNLQNQSDTKMKSIVTTIQHEQNQIIRDTKSDLLFVQGAAGSGKTAAVLQRIAYLLYRYRGNLSSSQVILFSPNQLFNDYIDHVLPELGEQNMVQMTYYQYTNRRVPNFDLETIGKRFNQTHNENEQNIYNFKDSLKFFDLVTKYGKHLNQENIQFKNIMFNGEIFISKDEIKSIYYGFNQNYNLRTRLQSTVESLMKKLNHHISSEMKKQWVEDEIESLSSQQLKEIYAKYGDKFKNQTEEYNFLAKEIVKNEFAKVRKQILRKRFININAQFVHLMRNIPNLINLKQYKINENDWQDNVEKTIEIMKNGDITNTDISIYLYLFDLISGKYPNKEIHYLFVDEVQDYTSFQLAYLKYNFPRAKFTLLGDLNQAIFTHDNNGGIINDLKSMFDEDKTRMIKLNKSYRSTAQITDFTKYLLDEDSQIESFSRDGLLPSINKTDSIKQAYDNLVKTINANNDLNESTAIIGKNLDECREIINQLKELNIDVSLIQTENQRLLNGVIVIPAYLAKGLEFDAVVMWNASDENYNSLDEKQLVYTICTRAMHKLDIISIGELSKLFNNIPRDKYEIV